MYQILARKQARVQLVTLALPYLEHEFPDRAPRQVKDPLINISDSNEVTMGEPELVDWARVEQENVIDHVHYFVLDHSLILGID